MNLSTHMLALAQDERRVVQMEAASFCLAALSIATAPVHIPQRCLAQYNTPLADPLSRTKLLFIFASTAIERIANIRHSFAYFRQHARSLKHMTQPRISTHYLLWLHDYLRSHGKDSSVLGPVPGYDELSFIPMTTWRSKLNLAAEHLADPDLGVHFGATIAPHRFGMLGYLLHHCENFGHVLQRAWHFRMLFFKLQEVTPLTMGNEMRIAWQLDDGEPDFQEESFAITATIQFARVITGQPLKPIAVGMMNGKQKKSDELEGFLGCPVHYQEKTTWIQADASIFSQPTAQPNAALSAVFEKQVDEVLASLPDEDPLVGTVRRHIMALLPEGEPTQERVAECMYISSRTLHRQLTESKHSFRDLLAETRRQLAENYLLNRRYGLSEIALLLGFGQQSSFTHAFKSWTGTTPSAWRKQNTQRLEK